MMDDEQVRLSLPDRRTEAPGNLSLNEYTHFVPEINLIGINNVDVRGKGSKNNAHDRVPLFSI